VHSYRLIERVERIEEESRVWNYSGTTDRISSCIHKQWIGFEDLIRGNYNPNGMLQKACYLGSFQFYFLIRFYSILSSSFIKWSLGATKSELNVIRVPFVKYRDTLILYIFITTHCEICEIKCGRKFEDLRIRARRSFAGLIAHDRAAPSSS